MRPPPKAAIVLAAALAAGCGSSSFRRVGAAGPVEISELELPYSNVYLLRDAGTKTAALVDAGSPGDEDALRVALEKEHLGVAGIRFVVLTHAHGDHAALARWLQRQGVRVVLGAGDASMARAGHNGVMPSTDVTAVLLKPFVDFAYPPFSADVLVDRPLDLDAAELPGVRLEPMPGHTPGSLVVFVGPRDAIVGDEMIGGIWGGALWPGTAGEHYYQTDLRRNHCNILRLLETPATRFYLGHGGPVDRASVEAFARTFAGEKPCG